MNRARLLSCAAATAIALGHGLGDEATAQPSLCASVRIEIAQEAVLERQAFDARMRIRNGGDTLAIEELAVSLSFRDAAGEPVVASSDPDHPSALFFLSLDALDGVDDINGTGTIPPQEAAEIRWLLIPAPGAATSLQGSLYVVGATVSYRLGATSEQVAVTPDTIVVKPMPDLAIDYFLAEEVYADDPLTQSIIEPAEPFTLGVRVRNDGLGPAHKVTIESAQPTIVDNELGLLIGFQINASFVDDSPVQPKLLIDFGDVPSLRARVGRWIMETNLSGYFLDFNAEFAHADELGGRLTSLVTSVDTHLLVRDVRVDLPGRDAIRDFLARDGDTLRVYESNAVDTVVADVSGDSTLSLLSTSGSAAIHSLAVPASVGMLFVQKPDPYDGTKEIVRVLRDDGKRLPAENAWFSKSGFGNETEYFLNLFDVNRGGIYQIEVDTALAGPQPPVLQFIPNWTVTAGERLEFIVTASDPDGTTPMLATGPLPIGAGFTDLGTGTGAFDWPTSANQVGSYYVTFRASDGLLEAARTTRIDVAPDLTTPTPSPTATLSPSPTVTRTPTTTRTATPTASATPTVTPTPPPDLICQTVHFQAPVQNLALDGSERAWFSTTLNHALIHDSSYALTGSPVSLGSYTDFLYLSHIAPAGLYDGIEIYGIELRYETMHASFRDYEVRVVRADGSLGAESRARADAYPSAATMLTRGSASDLWGESWCFAAAGDCADPQAINLAHPSTGFAIAQERHGSGAGTPRIYYAELDVCFTLAGGTPTPTETPTPTATATTTATHTVTPTPPPNLICEVLPFRTPVANVAFAGSSKAWIASWLDRAIGSDDLRVTTGSPVFVDAYTDYLYWSNLDASGLDDGVEIYGILFHYELQGGRFRDHAVRVRRSDLAIGSENRAAATKYPSSDGIVTRGAANDLWGEHWCVAAGDDCPDPTHVNLADPNTGVLLSVYHTSSGSGSGYPWIDHAELEVCYTAPAPTATPTPE